MLAIRPGESSALIQGGIEPTQDSRRPMLLAGPVPAF